MSAGEDRASAAVLCGDCGERPRATARATLCSQCYGQRRSGNRNATGTKGNKGNASAKGTKGNKGDASAKGTQGNEGNASAKGTQGNKGNANEGVLKKRAGEKGGFKASTSKGITIVQPYANLVVDGMKTIEVKPTDNAYRGRVHIVESGSNGQIIGSVEVYKTSLLKKREHFKEFAHQHRVSDLGLSPCAKYKNIWFWYLRGAKRASASFERKRGSVGAVVTSGRKVGKRQRPHFAP